MKRTIQSLIVAGMGLAIFFIACQKSDNAKPIQVISGGEVQVDSVAPSNPKSIYNNIGWQHNRIVGYLQNRYTGRDFEKILDCVNSHYEKEMCTSLPRQRLLNNLEAMKPILTNQDSFIRVMVHSEPLLKSYEKFKKDVDELYDRNSNYNDLKDYIIRYESEVNTDATMSKEERTLLLKTASVARYSIYYWMHTSKSPSTQFRSVNARGIFSKAFWVDVGVFLMTLGDTYTSGMYSSSFG